MPRREFPPVNTGIRPDNLPGGISLLGPETGDLLSINLEHPSPQPLQYTTIAAFPREQPTDLAAIHDARNTACGGGGAPRTFERSDVR